MSAIPSAAQYNLKPNAVKIERRQQSIPSATKRTFAMGQSSGETILFYLPALANTVADTQNAYLRFTIEIQNLNVAARTANLDNLASCVFQSLRIYGPGGALVEEIENLNVLYNALIDAQCHQSEKISQSAAWGTERTASIAQATFAGDAANTTAAELNAQIRTTNTSLNRSGIQLAVPARIGAGNPSTTKWSFSIPIISCLFALSEKFLPTYALSDDIRIEFQLGSIPQCFRWSHDPAADISVFIDSPEIVCDYLFLQPETMSAIQNFYQGRDLVLHTSSYHTYQTTLPANSTGLISQLLPSKVVSAKMLLSCFRPSAHVTSPTAYSLSSRVNPMWSRNDRFQLNVGGVLIPQHGLQIYNDYNAEMFFSELQKAFHAWGVMASDGNLTTDYYNVSTGAFGAAYPAPADGANSYRNGFLLGINLDSVVKNSDQVMSGLDLSRVTTYKNYRINTAMDAAMGAAGIVVHDFILHDQLLVIETATGGMTARF